MSSISGISTLIADLFSSIQDKSNTDLTEILSGDSSDSNTTDTITLSTACLEQVQSLFYSLNSAASDSDDDEDSIFDVLVTAQNNKLILENPEFLKTIEASIESGATDIDDIDLVNMSTTDLLSIISSSTQSSSEIDETV